MTRSDSTVSGAQRSDSAVPGAQITRSDLVNSWSRIRSSPKRWCALIGEVLTGLSWTEILGGMFNVIHLISLTAYGFFGLLSRNKGNYWSIFSYGNPLLTASFYLVLYCADVNKLTLSIFQRGEKEGTGTYWAKVGVMGIILPAFNFIGLIVTFIEVGQDRKTFGCGTAASISYFVGNALLLLSKGETNESEEHELRENNPPADSSPMDSSPTANLSVDNSPADNSRVSNSRAANSLADDSPVDDAPTANSLEANALVDNAPANNLPADSTPLDNSPMDNPPAANSLTYNSPVGNSATDNSPSIRNFP
ncbi:uncharacterized protein ZBAI_09909 [Zygosaccharomyces bailii ISA1307]|nr:uncharacterized protein ZBAI_09909 [Zygosaccharomyces bailii ISA1307]